MRSIDGLLNVRVLAGLMLLGVLALFLVLKQGSTQRPGTSQTTAALSVTPSGDAVDRLTPIRVAFREPPAERDASRLVKLEPAVDGEYVWQDDRTVLFQPAFPGLLRGYEYTIEVPAQPDAGLKQDFSTQFRTAGELAVANVIPAPNDVEVPEGAQVLVQFTRSVEPLTLLSEQPQDQVLVFDPPLAGAGEWLNTSLYRFVPDEDAIEPNTTYTITVPAQLTDQPDGVLSANYTWQFTTYKPALIEVTPGRDTQFVGLDQAIEMTFNQAMDHRSVEAGFSLMKSNGQAVPGSISWSDDATVATFTPAGGLEHSVAYRAIVPAGLQGANGGVTADEQTINFRTVGEPVVTRTTPSSGSTSADRYGVSFEFSNPMDPESFDANVSVSSFEEDEFQVYVQPDGLGAYISVPLEASTAYTVALEDGIKDRYGQPLAPYMLSFTTGRRQPQIVYAIPNQIVTFSASTEPFLYFHATNTAEANFTLYPLTRDEMRAIQSRGSIEDGPNRFTPSQAPITSVDREHLGCTGTRCCCSQPRCREIAVH